MSATLTEDDDLLAAEYVLGVLDGPDMAGAARRMGEPGFAGLVTLWERRLHPLAGLVAPVAPPPELWARLQRAIGEGRPESRTGQDNAPRPAGLAFWRGTTFAATAIAAVLAVLAVLPRHGAQLPATVAVAALAPLTGTAPAFIVQIRPDGALKVASLAPASVPSDRDLELWALPAGATKPVALGVLPAGGRDVAASTLTQAGGKLLVSLEPKGGSPTGQPTGPVLYGGVITRM